MKEREIGFIIIVIIIIIVAMMMMMMIIIIILIITIRLFKPFAVATTELQVVVNYTINKYTLNTTYMGTNMIDRKKDRNTTINFRYYKYFIVTKFFKRSVLHKT